MRYQGVIPPNPRHTDDFDAGSKYHIIADQDYIKYFVGTILQFQIYAELCETINHSGPLHTCDFYRSREAGRILRWKKSFFFIIQICISLTLLCFPVRWCNTVLLCHHLSCWRYWHGAKWIAFPRNRWFNFSIRWKRGWNSKIATITSDGIRTLRMLLSSNHSTVTPTKIASLSHTYGFLRSQSHSICSKLWQKK